MARIPASSSGGKTNLTARAGLYWRAVRWAAALALTIIGVGIVLKSPTAPARARAFCPPGQGTVRPPDPPGTIDGAKHPELIPDELAYKMLFLSLVEPENPTDEQKARQQAKIRMLRLSPDDEAALLAEVRQFRDQMSVLDGQVAEIHRVTPVPARGSADWLRLSDIQRHKDYLVTDTAARLGSRLSLDGGGKLQAHLGNVKRGIKRIPMPNMTGY